MPGQRHEMLWIKDSVDINRCRVDIEEIEVIIHE